MKIATILLFACIIHIDLIAQKNCDKQTDEPLTPFAPSSYSLFILLYALPTFTTGIVKNYKPMIVGAILTYVLFIISCYTSTKYDMLAGTIAAISCWLIPGLILRRNYLQQKNSNV